MQTNLLKYSELSIAKAIKLSAMAEGIIISKKAIKSLTKNGDPLSLFEYPTTGGITFYLKGAGFVNAPFNGFYEKTAKIHLDINEKSKQLFITVGDYKFSVKVLPLPSYLDKKDSKGRLVTQVIMSHADRVRLSPIQGCAFKCNFCDLNLKKYIIYPIQQLQEALDIALQDKSLPARHILISGGTPKKDDIEQLDLIYEYIIKSTLLPVDVMLAPRKKDITIVKQLFEWGIYGYSINLELFNKEYSKKITPQKNEIGLDAFSSYLEKAVELTNGNGRVRSLLLVGLEPIEDTIKGVKWIAERGCDPVLSPFRPAIGTSLSTYTPPSIDELYKLWCEANNIAERFSVKIGPRCIPCQHNALAFPDKSGNFNYSANISKA